MLITGSSKMMKRPIAISTLFILCVIGSCTKKPQVETPFTRVMGSWQKVQYATDDNGNGVIDQQEIRNQPLGFVDVLVFKPDTTGYEATSIDGSKDTAKFTWFVGGDSLYVAYTAHFSVVYFISHVSTGNLELMTGDSTGLQWYSYNKD
jgi:hypothetical protein